MKKIVKYRKNDDWDAIFVSVTVSELNSLEKIINEKSKCPDNKSTIDIVDTIVVSSDYTSSMERYINLIVYVAYV